MESDDNIIIYKNKEGNINIDAHFQHETIWLSQKMMARLFEVNIPAISKHLNNIYQEKELDKPSTISILETVQQEGNRTVKRKTVFYNLDAIISVGYRINSAKATQFRQWATNVLKDYLKQGYALNARLLAKKNADLLALKTAIKIIEQQNTVALEDKEKLYKFLKDFSGGLDLLDDYDHKQLKDKGKSNYSAVMIEPEEYMQVIQNMHPKFASGLFGVPKDKSFNSSVRQIYQTVSGADCYPTIEEKAAMLLYLIVKNHSFVDGNKRIAAACFLYFLQKNNVLYKNNLPILSDNTLFALTLLVAESDPAEKETMKQIVVSILNRPVLGNC